ncbi:class I lanthipeptide [Chitinophaga sp. RAB17]|uniref:class I lanthipeptide n=1 Tax=Chitinophaga sp. RAB17 TaxID=3233049 RepID=UPI003F9069F3
MRKRKMPLEKKLSLNKESIALLNTTQQAMIAGGLAPLTLRPPCLATQFETCVTIPPNRPNCIFCQSDL